ncbi:QWRF family protein [Dioscorea alata]|uniref:QWRF family protein n=2 Tax=Dioscorea alata TaxID=55571 RepID=A0ACB7VJE3_DIOAL|nr:QWRF family protein [Dioscorea alata]
MVETNSNPPLPPKPDNNEAKPPATEKRTRRRAREVSSRYMILPPGSPSSSISGDVHLAPSPLPLLPKAHTHHRKQRKAVPSSPDATDSESDSSSCFADENQPSIRFSETPLPSFIPHRLLTVKRKPAVRLFGDNAGEQQPHQQNNSRKQRPGTPMVLGFSVGNTPRLNLSSHNDARLMNGRRVAVPPRVSTCPLDVDNNGANGTEISSLENSVSSEQDACSISNMGGLCESPPIPSSKARSTSELRSSMPEADLLPTMSVRRKDGNEDYSICHRSLNSALSSCQQAPFTVSRSVSKNLVSQRLSSVTPKNAGPCLPPQPPNMKQVDVKKVKKAASRHEDIHSLRLLDNRYLQWRFANAKAQATVHAKMLTAERSLSEVLSNISELQNSVLTKKIELEHLKRMKNLFTILDAQTPILDVWSILEEDYSCSLSGAIEALQNASLQLPLTGNVRAGIEEIEEALGSATTMLQAISPSVNRFLPEAQEMEIIVSELARVVTREISLAQECGDLLSEVHTLQVKECSLRSQLMQGKRSCGVS